MQLAQGTEGLDIGAVIPGVDRDIYIRPLQERSDCRALATASRRPDLKHLAAPVRFKPECFGVGGDLACQRLGLCLALGAAPVQCLDRPLVLQTQPQPLELIPIEVVDKGCCRIGMASQAEIELDLAGIGVECLHAVIAGIDQPFDADNLFRLNGPASRDASDEGEAVAEPAQDIGGFGMDGDLLGPFHDRRERAVDVREDRCALGIGAQVLDHLFKSFSIRGRTHGLSIAPGNHGELRGNSDACLTPSVLGRFCVSSFRFIHTADWHLGRELHGADLGPAQAAFLEWLAELARDEHVDAVLMAGDIYDRALPPVPAVELFRDGLARLVEVAPVVLITGNHDSAVRMSLGPLMRPEITLRAGLGDLGTPVVIDGVAIYPVPYLEPQLYGAALEAEGGGHQAVIEAALRRCLVDLEARPAGTRSIAVAHAFVAGGEPSDSERRLAIGGAEYVAAALFDRFDYTALGHLHLPQQVTPTVVYSGSPIAYSFSEAATEKSVIVGELAADGELRFERRGVPAFKPISRLEGELEDLLTSPDFRQYEQHWLEVTLTDRVRPRGPMEQLRRRFPDLLSLRFSHDPVAVTSSSAERLARLEQRDPFDLASEFVEHVRGGPPSPPEAKLLRQALERQQSQERAA